MPTARFVAVGAIAIETRLPALTVAVAVPWSPCNLSVAVIVTAVEVTATPVAYPLAMIVILVGSDDDQ